MPRRLGHEPALDGVRGIAVLLVVFWHYLADVVHRSFSWFQSGHLGVDLFFVLSGFLITALMLNEHGTVGSISFRGFYRRRVFRLLPALVVFLSAQVAFAAVTDIPQVGPLSPGTDGVNQVASVVGALFFALNWLDQIGPGYHVSLGLIHLWSLSVEEQFYLLWPSIAVAMLTPRAALNQLVSLAAGAAVVFAGHNYVWDDSGDATRWAATLGGWLLLCGCLEMVRRRYDRSLWILAVVATVIGATLLYRNGHYAGGPELLELYVGTPSRADSLMVGAGLAFLWTRGWIPTRAPTWITIGAWAFFLWVVASRSLADPFLFEYGWTLVAIASALILWGSLGTDGTVYGRIISAKWLRAVGKVAYGLYLWHALIFVAVQHWWGDGSAVWTTALALSLTTLMTVSSWFFVERPLLAYKTPRTARR